MKAKRAKGYLTSVCIAACACKSPSGSNPSPATVASVAAASTSAPTNSGIKAPAAEPAPSAASVASAAELASAAPSADAASKAPLGGGAAIEVPFRGSLGSEKVIFRLTKTRARLEGRYFGEQRGVDVLLAGRIQPDGAFTLQEKATGATWNGTWQGQSLSGTRLLGTERLELTATRVEPAAGPNWAPVQIATKHIEAPCTAPGPKAAKFDYLELIGAFFPEREAEVNRQLAPEPDQNTCSVTSHLLLESRVLFNAQGIVSIELRSATVDDLRPDQVTLWLQQYRSYALQTQQQLKNDDVFAGGLFGKPLEQLFREYIPETRKQDAALDALEREREISVSADNDCFAVEGRGIRFIQQLSKAAWGGVLVPYQALDSRHALRPGPVAELAARALAPRK